ncbi:MAG: NAD(P)-binding domain-containing protein [Burkholderiaceae bacterium]
MKPGQALESGETAPHATGFDDIRRMVDGLRARLDKQPDDTQGWAILARSYSVLGEHAEAVKAFERASQGAGDDAGLLADYADALAMANGRTLQGEPLSLVQRALAIDPTHTKALSLAASAAFDDGDFKGAIAYWENLIATASSDHPLRAAAQKASKRRAPWPIYRAPRAKPTNAILDDRKRPLPGLPGRRTSVLPAPAQERPGERCRPPRAGPSGRPDRAAIAASGDRPGKLHRLGGCARACPEKALGIVDGRGVLVDASACIGHGACAAACPMDAIKLVFGTTTRVASTFPRLSCDFETNVPGIFIAGELGGMGLIRKAAEQGKQAMQAIARSLGGQAADGADCDVLIVGAGPAGLSAGLAAKELGLRYRIVEQERSLGGTIFHYPRGKITMTSPVQLALVGKLKIGQISKEELLEIWHDIVRRTELAIELGTRMLGIERDPAGVLRVSTDKGSITAGTVLLAIGRRGTPRRLDAPGEESSKVVYRLIDTEQYRGQRVLVVGGGDSALEAAIAVAQETGTKVTLSYRRSAFSRVKPGNRERCEELVARGAIRLRLESEVLAIGAEHVRLRTRDGEKRLPNDVVIVCAGGELPIPLLRGIGIAFDTHFGAAVTR